MRQRRKRQRQLRVGAVAVCGVLAIGLLFGAGWLLWGQNSLPAEAPGNTASLPAGPSVPEPEPEPQPTVTRLRFSATGDNLIHDGIYQQARARTGGESYDFGPLYENLKPFYEGFDINWINQETLVTDELPPSSYPQFCTPAACGRAIYDLGMRVIAMSNNHAYDKYADGIAATRRFWAGMPDDVVTTGLWAGEADYDRIPLQEKDGVTFAYLALSLIHI